ncbi:MAG TPA: SGNH/GDSL hydrolase family protein [Thermoanaerobaculia bacterium]|nr:SGNH/GDSL hydrolase family protein [Thermoanaerobaculia bacterium]
MKKDDVLRALGFAGLVLLGGSSSLPAATTFHKFVAVGDSLPAGHEANCTVDRYQVRSATYLIAQALGITDFQQPLISEVAPSQPLTGYPCLGAVVSNGSISVGIVSQEGATENQNLPRPYDNLGFNGGPRVKDFVDLKISVPGRSDLDNYAARVLRNVAGTPFAGTSAVEQAASLHPDLILYWVGNNDVLGAASTGVALDGVTLTPVADFEAKYLEGLTILQSTGATIVTFTIPDVTSIPLYKTLPPVVLDPVTRQPVLVNGQPVPLMGSRAFPPACPVAPCPLPPDTLIHTIKAPLLEAQGIGIPAALGGRAVLGSGDLATALPDGSFTPPAGPLVPGVLLYADEVAAIQSRTNEINDRIRADSAANGIVLYDLNARFAEIAQKGYSIGGITLTTAFLQGGLFSADGTHPTQIGYAIMADDIIQRVNAATGSAIPRPDIPHALFTPNASPFLGAAPAAVPGFVPQAWMSLLPILGPIDPDPVKDPRGRATRVVGR